MSVVLDVWLGLRDLGNEMLLKNDCATMTLSFEEVNPLVIAVAEKIQNNSDMTDY